MASKKKEKEEELTAEEKKKRTAKEKKQENAMLGGTVVLSIVIALALFFALPYFLSGLFKKVISSQMLIAFIEGVIRLAIFLGYIAIISLTPDIKRTFMYHGSEHKCINCIEHGLPLTVENVRKSSKHHKRCGTSFLLLVMIITILVYACLGWNESWLLRLGSRLIMLPIIAGLSYELLKFLAKHDNLLVRALRWPGLQLQRLTTREPDDSMIECAIIAFQMALDEKSPEELDALKNSYCRGQAKIKRKLSEKEEEYAKILAQDEQARNEQRLETLSKEIDNLNEELERLTSKYEETGRKYESGASA